MSHDKTHRQLGDSGVSRGSDSKSERSGRESSEKSSTFHALHHEATGSLSGPSSQESTRHSVAASGAQTEHSLSKPAIAKGAESGHTAHSSRTVDEHALFRSTKVSHGFELNNIPKISLTDGNTRQANSDLTRLVPGHLLLSGQADRPLVHRTAGEGNTNNLFKPQDGKDAGDLKITPLVAQFDSSKKIAEMINAGQIVDRTSAMVGDQNAEKARLAPGEVPSIKIEYNNEGDKQKPDFLIKKDGSVEMFNNPQLTGQKEIVVQFERDGANFALTDAQKAAGANFYNYLQGQLKAQFPQAAADAFKTNDSEGLLRSADLPPEVKANLDKKPEVNPSSGLPENAGPTIRDTNRISRGGPTSQVPRGDVDAMTPPAKRIPNEAERMAAMKDTVASYVTRGESKPYDHVSKRGDRGWGVGRYGMTYNQLEGWLNGLTEEQIAELVKQGKLTPDAAKNLKKMKDSLKSGELHPFLKQMKEGTGTAQEMQAGVKEFLPDKVQELAASDQISKISGELSADAVKRGEQPSVDPGQVALSFVLGRTITKQDMENNPDYKQFAESARQAYRLQEQAREQTGGIINVENMRQVSDALNKMVGEQFWREAASATEYGNKGCAIAVTRALQRMGVQIGTHLDVSGTWADMRRRGWKEVSVAEAMRSGQLFVPVNKETGSHIGLGLGNQVWENSSGQRQFVTRNMSASTLRNSGRAFIVPINETNKSST